jgi:signal transduction histidine kinase
VQRVRRLLVDNAEALVLGGALLVIATLLVWWGVFATRLIHERETLALGVLKATLDDPSKFADEIARVHERTNLQLTMIAGEGSVFAVLLVVSVVALWFVARQRRLAAARLVRLVQFTTHELKTPIAGVRALLQSLQLGSIPQEAQGKFLDQGLLETNRLEHLAETILAFQRAASKRQLKPVATSTDGLIVEVIEHRGRTFGTERIVRGKTAPAEIVVDKDAFRVVLENLLDNARKYGGGQVEMHESVDGNRWRLEVKDAGDGFDPGDAERLFEPFERDTKEGVAKHGSGLGLYISRQLMRAMKGELSAKSEGAGKGAVFTMDLPLATTTSSTVAVASTAAEPSHG